MRILLTGSNGFLGSTVLNQIQKSKHNVIPIVRRKKNSYDVECDLGNPTLILKLLNKYKPEAIINCAAKVDFSEISSKEQYNVNALAPAIIASWCFDNGAHIIQVSGSIVNGNSTNFFSIDSLEIPTNNYGRTKLFADQAIRLSQCSYTIVRFGGIFGTKGPTHLGINIAINKAKNGENLSIFGQGKALRNYIHVQDAAKVLLFCLDNKIKGTHYSGNNQSISIAEMINDICSVYLNNAKPEYLEGDESKDQIVIVSPLLPRTLTFKKSLQNYL